MRLISDKTMMHFLKDNPMHSQFMEFFGNYLIQAARWQKLVEHSASDGKPDNGGTRQSVPKGLRH